MPVALRCAGNAALVRLRFFGQWRSLPDLEQPCLHELGGEQRQLRVTVRFAIQSPDVPAVKVWRVGLGEQFVKRLSSNEVGIHIVFSPHTLWLSNLVASGRFQNGRYEYGSIAADGPQSH